VNEEEKRATPGKAANDEALHRALKDCRSERGRQVAAALEERNLLPMEELEHHFADPANNAGKLEELSGLLRKAMKIAIVLVALLAIGCTSLKDAIALFASLADKTGEVENWHGVVEQAGIAPGSFAREKSLEGIATTPDILGLETILVKLSSGEIYPVICPATMTIRCQQFATGTKVFINEGNIVDCNVIRDEVLYGSCIAARQLRQEM
jgi:hypothetical protein